MQPIVFLHGFLGSGADWAELTALLQECFQCHVIDLPSHDLVSGVMQKLDALNVTECAVVGYSMGGRLALLLKDRFPERIKAAVAISAHFGLRDATQRKARWEHDLKWIELLSTAPLEQFLTKWYEQPLFASLKNHPEKFAQMLQRRRAQHPQALIATLREFSLAHQPYIFSPEALYICGADDLTYVTLYRTLPASFQVRIIPDCGHNAVLEKPVECATEINLFLESAYVKF